MAKACLSTRNIEDYQKFLKIKSMPSYAFSGCVATFPDEYAAIRNCERGLSMCGKRNAPLFA